MNDNTPESNNGKLDTWDLVELFGHQKIVGKVTEASIAGGAFLRVDVPAYQENKAFTRFYSPGSIYSINPVSDDVGMELLKQHRNEPVSRWELPQLADKAQEESQEEQDEDREY